MENNYVEQVRLTNAALREIAQAYAALREIHKAYGALTAGLIAKEALGMALSRSERFLLDEWRAQEFGKEFSNA